jgi:putative RNA 2'-phosphotransferase
VIDHLDITQEILEDIVNTDKKKRYTIKETKIRANQGHSLSNIMAVDLTPETPPSELFHGSTWDAWLKIREDGEVKKMRRHHVHMSADHETAMILGRRWKHKWPVVLWIDAEYMHQNEYGFYVSDNGVWLTDVVPVKYVRTCEGVQ